MGACGEARKYHEIGINLGKIEVLTRARSREIREISKTIPNKYRGMQFVQETKLHGQRIDLGKKEIARQTKDSSKKSRLSGGN